MFNNMKFKIKNCKKGMTYIELVVVMSIFAIMSAISFSNFKEFQSRIELKNLATNIAFKILEAQKNAVNGKLSPPLPWLQPIPDWKPSYGVYFNIGGNGQPPNPNIGRTIFYYYVDLDQNKYFSDAVPSGSYTCNDECLEVITITNGSYIYDVIDSGGFSFSFNPQGIENLHLNFTRPKHTSEVSAIPSAGNWGGVWFDIILASPDLPVPVYPNYEDATKVRIWNNGRIEIK